MKRSELIDASAGITSITGPGTFNYRTRHHYLRLILEEYVAYYNHHRPHSSLGPGIPDPAEGLPVEPQADRHRLPAGTNVVSTPILGGLHHTYWLAKAA